MTQAEVVPTESAPLTRLIGRADGPGPGPTFVLIGGLHANEPSGIEASERLLSALNGGEPLVRGRVVALRGNLAGLRAEAEEPWLRPRYIDVDLNRSFVDGGPPEGASESRECAELAGALREIVESSEGPVCVLDLHTFSSDSPAFVAVEDSLANQRFAMRIGLPKILGLEEELRGLLMDYAGRELGCVSCIIESGRHEDPASVDVHEAAVRVALAGEGMLEAPGLVRGRDARDLLREAARGRDKKLYDVRRRQLIVHGSYRSADTAHAFARVGAGRTVVGYEDGEPVTAPESGLLFMPNRQRDPRPGDDAFFVVRPVGRVWLGLSAWLRTRERLHRALPRLLPGVRNRPGHPGELLIAPGIAAVLRREVLHLLGYRLVRWEHPAPMGRATRVWKGCGAVAGSLWRMARGIPYGGERVGLPVEQELDWVARRRALDLRDRDARDRDRG